MENLYKTNFKNEFKKDYFNLMNSNNQINSNYAQAQGDLFIKQEILKSLFLKFELISPKKNIEYLSNNQASILRIPINNQIQRNNNPSQIQYQELVQNTNDNSRTNIVRNSINNNNIIIENLNDILEKMLKNNKLGGV